MDAAILKPNKSTILIVDDTPVNLGVVVESLESRNYRVVVAQDGEEGLQRAIFVKPDLILLDVMMPGMDGFEVCRCLKDNADIADIPVIFMTALAETEHKVTGFKVGGVDYITKPMQVDEVIARVGMHLNLRTLQCQLQAQNAQLQKHQAELEQQVIQRTTQLRTLAAKREEEREEERKRIAREIHDELGQLLNVLRLNVTTLDFRFGDANADLREKANKMVSTLDRAFLVVRNLATRLRPAVLKAGIVYALEWLVEEYAESTGIVCDLHLPADDISLNEDRAMVVFRIVQESLTNVLRHSGADYIEITLRSVVGFCEVEVRDNGKGFDPDSIDRPNAFGIVGMRERALILKGTLDIANAQEGGTVLKLCIPIE